MSPIRVLVVDDSVVVRRMLSDMLSTDPMVEVVGAAATGSIALQRIAQVDVDLVILDVEMPDMDGIETVRRIRQTAPNLPVLMCSSLTERGADVTLRALAAGASDYIAKPTANGNGAGGAFRADLLAKVKALRPPPPSEMLEVVRPVAPPPEPRRAARTQQVTALAIGCSTGGPNALSLLFSTLPGDLPVPIFIVQHMPPVFTKLLADRLSAASAVRVFEAQHGDVVEPGRAYVAPGDHHMTVVRDGTHVRIQLNRDAPENSCRPAVDVLFRSLSRLYGPGVLAAVLTGMGHDGTRGAQALVDAGGSVIVQDAASCVVASMPSSVAAAGLAEAVVEMNQIAGELVRRTRLRPARPYDAHARLET